VKKLTPELLLSSYFVPLCLRPFVPWSLKIRTMKWLRRKGRCH